jgi:hypothetical protein
LGGLGGESCLLGESVDGVGVGAVGCAEWRWQGWVGVGEFGEAGAEEAVVQAGEEQGVA